MSSPDFRAFVDTLVAGHQAWLASPPSPLTGNDLFDHYVGDNLHPGGLLWVYEAWRAEHGYTRVRPWNGVEALGRAGTATIPHPGSLTPFSGTAPAGGAAPGPSLDSRLADGRTIAQLQADFPGGANDLGTAIFAHWSNLEAFGTPFGTAEINRPEWAIYSIRFWGFMKWAAVLRNRLAGVPVFPIPIVYDADGVPLSDIEFIDQENLWHFCWHTFPPPCAQVTSQQTNNPFAPSNSTFGQICQRPGQPAEFFVFHRDVLRTYDNWRQRAGMPKVGRWRPPGLHFHDLCLGTTVGTPNNLFPAGPGSCTANQTYLPEVLLNDTDLTAEYNQIKDRVQHFNDPALLSNYAEGSIHNAGHTAPTDPDIYPIDMNNYSPRFFGWHWWIDHLWEVRQPRFSSLRPVASDGSAYRGILTPVRPTPNPDRVEPNNALTGLTVDGRGSVWIRYNVRPETWGRDVTLTVTGEVYLNSSDLSKVAGLDATPITIPVPAAAQGTDSAPIEVKFLGLDGAAAGTFTRRSLPGGAIGFKNGRIRITGRLVPVGNIPTSLAPGNDQFDYSEPIDIILVNENQPPLVSSLLNKSAFSLDEVVVNTSGAALSSFANSFFVVLQDPPLPPKGYDSTSIFADPARTAVSGIFVDTALAPTVAVVNNAGTTPVDWFSVVLTDVFKEDPSLDDNVTQRVLFRYLAIFDVAKVTALLPNPGDVTYARLKISARDRAGNAIQNVLSPPIKLFRAAHPYMIDVLGTNPSWLSIDTRVFQVKASENKFAHSVSASGSPNQYIKDVIGEFNAGSQNFDAIPADEGQAQLELAPVVAGVNVYDFALAKVRMRTQAPVPNVKTFFRLFTTAFSDLSFTPTNYPTSTGASPVALLGRSSSPVEIVSIPCFAEPRVETRDALGGVSMTTQQDPANTQTFATTPPGGETIRYFGAYLDINSDTPRFPAEPAGDGPFTSAQCVSIRNILRGQHQCMVVEVFYPPDPTEPNSTPASSDHLAQRNLAIVETANPGIEATHTAQHSFDLVLPDQWTRQQMAEEQRRSLVISQRFAEGPRDQGVAARQAPVLSSFALVEGAAAPAWPERFGLSRTEGFDELLLFWNNVPPDATAEIYLPSIDVEYVMFLRRLRRAPGTVRAIDAHTLALDTQAVTYVPIPNLGVNRIAGTITIKLPDTIKAGELYVIDVVQMRAPLGAVVGGFRIAIPVSKAARLYSREARTLATFENRLRLTPPQNRWHPVLLKQVEYLRARAQSFAEEAADECGEPGGDGDGVRLRVILERIKVLDAYGPLVHGSGELSLVSRVTSTDLGGVGRRTRTPTTGAYPVLDQPGGFVIDINREIFRGTVVDDLSVEISSEEVDATGGMYRYHRAFAGKPNQWFGTYRPKDEVRDPEDVGDWQVWYRIERV